jgi:hypothetical protein
MYNLLNAIFFEKEKIPAELQGSGVRKQSGILKGWFEVY